MIGKINIQLIIVMNAAGKIKVIIQLRGGLVVQVNTNDPNVAVEILDIDNMQAAGQDNSSIEREIDRLTSQAPYVIS